jgi:uncharacterized membrane protein
VLDPTTAVEAIVHLGSLLRELLNRDLPARIIAGSDERRLFRPHDLDHGDYVSLSFGQIRRAAASEPVVSSAALEVMADLAEDLEAEDLTERAMLLRHEGRRFVDELRASDLSPDDLAPVERAAVRLGIGAD